PSPRGRDRFARSPRRAPPPAPARRASSLLEPLLDRLDQRPQHLHPGEELVLRLDQRPGRDLGAGPVDHVARRPPVRVPLGAVAPVLFRDLEALERAPLALAEAAELLLLAHLEPELDEDEAVPGELLLEVVDLGVRAHPVRLGGEALDALDEHAAVPRPVNIPSIPRPGM